MADITEPLEPYERTHRLVEALLNGERPATWPGLSPEEAEMVRVASALNEAGSHPRPEPEFLRTLTRRMEEISEPASRRLWGRLTRRGMLRGLASAAGLLAVGAVGDRVAGGIGRSKAGAGWVAVARLADVPSGTATRFLAAGREGYVLNLDGALSAVSALCTHLPCVLQWSGGQREFICPCHQAEFSAEGQHTPTPNYDLQLPPLGSFPVKQIGQLVYVFPGESSQNASPGELEEDQEYSKP